MSSISENTYFTFIFFRCSDPNCFTCAQYDSSKKEGICSLCNQDYILHQGNCILCSNEIIDQDEECDDGNLQDSDGCSSSCKVEQNYFC